jgi:hypothetical protein
MEESQSVSPLPIDMAISFALKERGFDPTQVNPAQIEAIMKIIGGYTSPHEYHPVNISPLEELGLLAFCRLTNTKPPLNLRWTWNEEVRKNLNLLIPLEPKSIIKTKP